MKNLRLSILVLSFLSFSLLIPLAAGEALKVTSKPNGANVEIDGVVVGTTPYEVKLPGGYFHKTHTVFEARLEHPMILRVSLDGYTSKEITMTEGPMQWQSLNGVNHGNWSNGSRNSFMIFLRVSSSASFAWRVPDRRLFRGGTPR